MLPSLFHLGSFSTLRQVAHLPSHWWTLVCIHSSLAYSITHPLARYPSRPLTTSVLSMQVLIPGKERSSSGSTSRIFWRLILAARLIGSILCPECSSDLPHLSQRSCSQFSSCTVTSLSGWLAHHCSSFPVSANRQGRVHYQWFM